MIDFKKMKTAEKTYILVPDWDCRELQFALEISGEEGWEFLEHDNVPEEIRKNFTEGELQYGRFFVSNFDTDALGAVIPYIGYDMDIQAAHEEQDYQEMRKAWDRHKGKAGDLWDGNTWRAEEMCLETGEYEENGVDIIAETMYDELDEDDIYDEDDLEYEESENDPDEYYDDHYGEYYEEDIPENDDLTEEEILEYDRKRDGRRYLDSTAADFMSRTCEEEAIETLIKENAEAIAEWLSDEKANEWISFEHDDEEESLSRVARHGDSVLCEYLKTGSEICLEKDETNEFGFIISDIFVVITHYMKEFDAQDENAPVREYYSISPEEMKKREEENKEFIEKIKNMDIFA